MATSSQASAPPPSTPSLALNRQRPASQADSSSDLAYFLKAVGWMFAGLLGMVALYALGFLMNDSMAAGKALTEAKLQRSTLVCQAGRMSHGDGSLHDLVFADAYFVCTDWKTLETIQSEEKELQNKGATKIYQ